MWKGTLVVKIIMIILSFVVFSFGVTPLWIALGLVVLASGCFMAFRQGQGAGHEACGVSKSLERIADDPAKMETVDKKMFKRAWSVSTAAKAVFAGGLPGYVINAVYIVCMLMAANDMVILITRFASWVATLVYLPIVIYWHPVYNVLTWDLLLVMMIGPFLLPFVQFLGYLQGPKLWEKTEKAMAEGKRRAKARSRIVKKKKVQPRGPEI